MRISENRVQEVESLLAGANRAMLGFANKQAAEQVGKTVKDFCPQQGAEHRDEIKQGRW